VRSDRGRRASTAIPPDARSAVAPGLLDHVRPMPPAIPVLPAAPSAPKLTVWSPPIPSLRCPTNVQPIALFYTACDLLHRSAGILGANRPPNARPPLAVGITVCCAIQVELRAFPKEALISSAAFLQSTAISGRAALVNAEQQRHLAQRHS